MPLLQPGAGDVVAGGEDLIREIACGWLGSLQFGQESQCRRVDGIIIRTTAAKGLIQRRRIDGVGDGVAHGNLREDGRRRIAQFIGQHAVGMYSA